MGAWRRLLGEEYLAENAWQFKTASLRGRGGEEGCGSERDVAV